MPFPDSPRVVYARNPLIEVICQLRFPSVLRIGAETPADYQDRIRQEYPLYSVQQPSVELPPLPKELSALLAQFQLASPPGLTTHRFSTKDSGKFVTLAKDFIAYTESKYERWERFRAELKSAVEALEEIYRPAFYTRVGLRYKDLISRERLGLADADWADLLQAHILGELGDPRVSDAIESREVQTVITLPDPPGGQATIRHGLATMSERNEVCYLIDVDFAVAATEGIDDPFGVLDRFNRSAGNLFRWAITDRLHNAMGPAEIRPV